MTTADSATTFAAPHRPLAVRVVNALAAIVPSHPRLDVASVVKASGIADARLDAPEDAMFLDRLQALLADANGAAQLNHVGRWIVRAKLGRIVGNRLRVRQWMREHPGTRDVEVRTPLFIVGQPRTGTTLLYGLLAQDPQARAPRVWEVNAPVPPPKAGLAAAFPDACIMQTHRDPLESIPSLCSLVATVRSASSDRVDLHRVGEATLDWFG